MVSEAIEQSGGHFRIGKNARPFAEGEICGDDDRGALVEPADEVEEQLAAADILKFASSAKIRASTASAAPIRPS